MAGAFFMLRLSHHAAGEIDPGSALNKVWRDRDWHDKEGVILVHKHLLANGLSGHCGFQRIGAGRNILKPILTERRSTS